MLTSNPDLDQVCSHNTTMEQLGLEWISNEPVLLMTRDNGARLETREHLQVQTNSKSTSLQKRVANLELMEPVDVNTARRILSETKSSTLSLCCTGTNTFMGLKSVENGWEAVDMKVGPLIDSLDANINHLLEPVLDSREIREFNENCSSKKMVCILEKNLLSSSESSEIKFINESVSKLVIQSVDASVDPENYPQTAQLRNECSRLDRTEGSSSFEERIEPFIERHLKRKLTRSTLSTRQDLDFCEDLWQTTLDLSVAATESFTIAVLRQAHSLDLKPFISKTNDTQLAQALRNYILVGSRVNLDSVYPQIREIGLYKIKKDLMHSLIEKQLLTSFDIQLLESVEFIDKRVKILLRLVELVELLDLIVVRPKQMQRSILESALELFLSEIPKVVIFEYSFPSNSPETEQLLVSSEFESVELSHSFADKKIKCLLLKTDVGYETRLGVAEKLIKLR